MFSCSAEVLDEGVCELESSICVLLRFDRMAANFLCFSSQFIKMSIGNFLTSSGVLVKLSLELGGFLFDVTSNTCKLFSVVIGGIVVT